MGLSEDFDKVFGKKNKSNMDHFQFQLCEIIKRGLDWIGWDGSNQVNF